MFRFAQGDICVAVDYRRGWFDRYSTVREIKNSGFGQILDGGRSLGEHQLHARLLACNAFKDARINELSQINYSLSHTKDAAAVCWTSSKDLVRVGVDIEPVTRCLPAASAKFFLNESDCLDELNLLERWCVKEAAFKCLDDYDRVLNLPNIRVVPLNNKVYHAQAKSIECECTLLPNSLGYLIATAWR